jgi:hypothetical protein
MYKHLIFIFVFIASSVVAQQKILLMSGIEIEGKNIKVDEEFVHYEYTQKDEVKTNSIEIYRVFAIYDEQSKEQVIYERDSLFGRDLTVQEMRYFIFGEQDARKVFKSPSSTIASFIIGAGSGFAINFFAIPVPFAATIIISSIKPRLTPDKLEHKTHLKEYSYYDGYRRIARNKKRGNALWGGFAGVAVGISSYYVFL